MKWNTLTTNRPYVKTAVLSVLIHLLFFSLAFFTGDAHLASPPPPPIEIEIEPSRLLDMGSGRLDLGSGSPPPEPGMAKTPKARTAPKPVPRKAPPPKAEVMKTAAVSSPAPTGTYPPAAPGEPLEGSVAVPASHGRQGEVAGAGDGGVGGSGTRGSTGAGRGTGEYAGAGYRSGTLPAYPSAARRAGREGAVLLRVLVGTDGSPASVSVRETSGYDDFDSVAAQAVKKWRFSPARRAGQAVASFHDVRVRFRLEGVR